MITMSSLSLEVLGSEPGMSIGNSFYAYLRWGYLRWPLLFISWIFDCAILACAYRFVDNVRIVRVKILFRRILVLASLSRVAMTEKWKRKYIFYCWDWGTKVCMDPWNMECCTSTLRWSAFYFERAYLKRFCLVFGERISTRFLKNHPRRSVVHFGGPLLVESP